MFSSILHCRHEFIIKTARHKFQFVAVFINISIFRNSVLKLPCLHKFSIKTASFDSEQFSVECHIFVETVVKLINMTDFDLEHPVQHKSFSS